MLKPYSRNTFRTRFLLKFHAIHHSTEHLDWASGFRGHPLDGTILAPAFVFLVSAGFSFELTGALAAAQLILGLFLSKHDFRIFITTYNFSYAIMWEWSNLLQSNECNVTSFLLRPRVVKIIIHSTSNQNNPANLIIRKQIKLIPFACLHIIR